MAALDFPASPAVGQQYPSPAISGTPVYQWDGSKWITQLSTKSVVYNDGSIPMTAALTLSGDPVNPTDAADKHYVDNIAVPGSIPSGSVMCFWQASAPAGWTQNASQNDKALRVVNGAGGVSGGTNPFSSVMAQTVTGNHTLALSELPAGIASSSSQSINVALSSGTFPISAYWSLQSGTPGGTPYMSQAGPSGNSYSGGMGGTNTISVTSGNTGGGAHSHPITMAIQYIDVILASKN